MTIIFNFYNNGPNGPTIYYDYPMSQPVSSSSPAIISFCEIAFLNPLSIPLYAQVSGSVTLASGSTASVSINTINLGEIPANTTQTPISFIPKNIYISSYPSISGMNEVETLNITVSLYTDSGYTQLLETGNFNFRLDFINSNNSGFTKVIDYDGNTTPSVAYNNITSLTYVNSPALVSNGYSIEVNSNTMPSTAYAYFTNSGGIYNANGVYSLAEFFIYTPEITTSYTDLPFELYNTPSTDIFSTPGLNITTLNTWQIVYISLYSPSGNGMNYSGYDLPLIALPSTGEYYLGYLVILESTTNFL